MYRFTYIMACSAVVLFAASCTKEGCTDSDAVNFNEEAAADDGSCIIEGCIDQSADNFNPDANLNSGTCLYNRLLTIYSQVTSFGTYDVDNRAYLSVFVNSSKAGEISDYCAQDSITCHTVCSKLSVDGIRQGEHKVSYLLLRSNSSAIPDTLKYGDTVRVRIDKSTCKTVVLQ